MFILLKTDTNTHIFISLVLPMPSWYMTRETILGLEEYKDSGLLKLIPSEYYISYFNCENYKTKSIITAGCHFYLWYIEMWLCRLFLDRKVLQQTSQIWTNPSICVSTWLLIICLLLLLFLQTLQANILTEPSQFSTIIADLRPSRLSYNYHRHY